MTFFIGAECLDVKDRSCVDVCPVDCIYEGDRRMYINPNECIDCGACESVCPVEAVLADRVADTNDQVYLADNAAFFSSILRGRSTPLGDPGGASALGAVGVDTEMVRACSEDG